MFLPSPSLPDGNPVPPSPIEGGAAKPATPGDGAFARVLGARVAVGESGPESDKARGSTLELLPIDTPTVAPATSNLLSDLDRQGPFLERVPVLETASDPKVETAPPDEATESVEEPPVEIKVPVVSAKEAKPDTPVELLLSATIAPRLGESSSASVAGARVVDGAEPGLNPKPEEFKVGVVGAPLANKDFSDLTAGERRPTNDPANPQNLRNGVMAGPTGDENTESTVPVRQVSEPASKADKAAESAPRPQKPDAMLATPATSTASRPSDPAIVAIAPNGGSEAEGSLRQAREASAGVQSTLETSRPTVPATGFDPVDHPIEPKVPTPAAKAESSEPGKVATSHQPVSPEETKANPDAGRSLPPAPVASTSPPLPVAQASVAAPSSAKQMLSARFGNATEDQEKAPLRAEIEIPRADRADMATGARQKIAHPAALLPTAAGPAILAQTEPRPLEVPAFDLIPEAALDGIAGEGRSVEGAPRADTPVGAARTADLPRPAMNQIIDALRNAQGSIDIMLSPEELGRVNLTMHTQDGILSVVVTAERPETADLIRRSLDLLLQEAEAQGFDDVSFAFGGEGEAGQGFSEDRTDSPSPPAPSPVFESLEHTEPMQQRDVAQGLDLRL